MNPFEYDEARRQAVQLENKLRDLIDNPSDPLVRNLLDVSRTIEDDLQTKENPRSIEDRVKKLLSMMDEINRQESNVIDSRHLVSLRGQYENLQMSLRKFENY